MVTPLLPSESEIIVLSTSICSQSSDNSDAVQSADCEPSLPDGHATLQPSQNNPAIAMPSNSGSRIPSFTNHNVQSLPAMASECTETQPGSSLVIQHPTYAADSPILPHGQLLDEQSLSQSTKVVSEPRLGLNEEEGRLVVSEPFLSSNDEGSPPSKRFQNDPDPLALQSSPSPSPSITSRSTLLPSGSLFRDFDGVHHSSTTGDVINGNNGDGFLSREVSTDYLPLQGCQEENVEVATHLVPSGQGFPSSSQSRQWAEPPPSSDMLYYPAPVPTTLNLPIRLSRHSAAKTDTDRRSLALASIPVEACKSDLWLPVEMNASGQPHGKSRDLSPGNKKIKQNTQDILSSRALPPQLRASVYFEQQSVPQHVTIQNGSAVATLEKLLDVSAEAPVDVFTGDRILSCSTPAVHEHEQQESSTFSHSARVVAEAKAVVLGDQVNVKTRPSYASRLIGKRASTGQMNRVWNRTIAQSASDAGQEETISPREDSLIDQGRPINCQDFMAHVSTNLACAPAGETERTTAGERPERSREESYEVDGDVDIPSQDEHNRVPPSTLMAELQLRKQKLKERNRSADTRGLSSTLLELEAVAQIERQRRIGKPITLAWEDPNAASAAAPMPDDDDIPLGVLFPHRNGVIGRTGELDWDRPLGLLAKRQLDDNEPLSRRRNRLKGIPNTPTDKNAHGQANLICKESRSQLNEDMMSTEETLAQRTRRLKTSKALDDAIDEPKSRQVSASFASEIFSRLGVPSESDEMTSAEATTPIIDIRAQEERLGQRRKRLQAEVHAGKSTNPPQTVQSGSVIRSKPSSASLPTTYTVGDNRQYSHQIGPPVSVGKVGLLGESVQQKHSSSRHVSEQSVKVMSVSTHSSSARVSIQAASRVPGLREGKKNISGIHKNGPRDIIPKNRRATTNPSLSAPGISGTSMNFGIGHGSTHSFAAGLGAVGSGFGPVPGHASGIHNHTSGYAGVQTPQGMTGAHPVLGASESPPMMQTQKLPLSHNQRDNIDRWRQSVLK